MPLIMLEGRPVEYEIIPHPRRKRLTLEVNREGCVRVRAPEGAERAQIEAFIRSARQWLLERLDPDRPSAPPARGRGRIEDDHGAIEFRLTRNPRRKRIALIVHRDGNIEVRAPQNASDEHVEDFVRNQADWVRGRLAQAAATPRRRWVDGETLLYRGEPHVLEVRTHEYPVATAVARDRSLLIMVPHTHHDGARAESVRRAVHRWMVDRALEVTRERLPELAQHVGVSPRRVTIKDMKTRWGSCSHKGNISISFRIVMAPPEVMDYLIIHELCHMAHPNHSPDFWRLVGTIIPEYECHRAWLRKHGGELEF